MRNYKKNVPKRSAYRPRLRRDVLRHGLHLTWTSSPTWTSSGFMPTIGPGKCCSHDCPLQVREHGEVPYCLNNLAIYTDPGAYQIPGPNCPRYKP